MLRLSYPGKLGLGVGKLVKKLALGHTRLPCSNLNSISRPEFELPETSARVRARCAAGVRRFCGGRLPGQRQTVARAFRMAGLRCIAAFRFAPNEAACESPLFPIVNEYSRPWPSNIRWCITRRMR